METLHIIDGHLLVERDGAYHLLDTGVPHSMPAPAMVSEVLGVRVTRLIGTSELARSPIRIDWPGRRITFGATPAARAERVPLAMSPLGVPLIEFTHEDRKAHAVFDTGAPLSYAPSSVMDRVSSIRTVEDFMPMFGKFTTPVYRMSLGVGTRIIDADCGVLPDLLQLALGLMLPDGWILGTALLADRVTVIDLPGGALWYER